MAACVLPASSRSVPLFPLHRLKLTFSSRIATGRRTSAPTQASSRLAGTFSAAEGRIPGRTTAAGVTRTTTRYVSRFSPAKPSHFLSLLPETHDAVKNSYIEKKNSTLANLESDAKSSLTGGRLRWQSRRTAFFSFNRFVSFFLLSSLVKLMHLIFTGPRLRAGTHSCDGIGRRRLVFLCISSARGVDVPPCSFPFPFLRTFPTNLIPFRRTRQRAPGEPGLNRVVPSFLVLPVFAFLLLGLSYPPCPFLL
jgi:hypothetical protein